MQKSICIKLQLFWQIVIFSFSATFGLKSGPLNSTLDCNNTGVSLYCRDLTDEVYEVCHFCVNGTAVCNRIHYKVMICRYGHVYIRDSYCATYNDENNSIEYGKCIYSYERNQFDHLDDGYSKLPQNISELNVYMCGDLHRDKTLCWRCEDTYYPMAFSYNTSCVKCEQTHWNKLVLFVFVPLTVFCYLIIIFNINITSTYLHGFILFSQAVSIPEMSRAILLSLNGNSKFIIFVKVIGSFFSIWNLDILRMFSPIICFHMKYISILSLDLIIGLYPLVLVIITYFMISLYDKKYTIVRLLWKPFHYLLSRFHHHFKVKTSIIDSFATVLVLSNVKFMSVCFDMLASVMVYELSSSNTIHRENKLFYDAHSRVLSQKFRTLVILIILFLCIIFPIIILVIYPFRWFHKLLNVIPLRWHILHTFVDVFQGGFKNGSNGKTRDFRWFSALFLIIRLLGFIIYVITLSSIFFYYAAMVGIFIIILLITMQPFRSEQENYINISFLLLLSAWYVGVTGIDIAHIKDFSHIVYFQGLCSVIGVLPVVFILVLLFYWIKKQTLYK